MDTTTTLWYTRPADQWNEALPVGNGRLGAMIFGGYPSERLSLNEETVWAGRASRKVNPLGRTQLPQIRKLLFAGKIAEAERLTTAAMLSAEQVRSYQPLADLLIDYRGELWRHVRFESYRRQLDLESAVHLTTLHDRRERFTQRCFVSAVDQVICLDATTDHPEGFHASIRLDRGRHIDSNRACGNEIVLSGSLGEGEVCFAAVVEVRVDRGAMHPQGNALHVVGANRLELRIAGASSFVGPHDVSADAVARCRKALDGSSGKSFERLLDDHQAEHREKFGRVSIELPQSRCSGLPTDQRLAAVKAGQNDPALAGLYMQYGRYLLLGSSRPGCKPANLQGLWNHHLSAPWSSDYHTNINLQMNYWPAGPTNLVECERPLIDWMNDLAASGAVTARELYGCDGWTAHHASDIFAHSVPFGGFFSVWPLASAWLARHVFDHFLFTDDIDLLRQQFHLIEGACRFMLDFLVEAPPGSTVAGRLVTAPSHSPENAYVKDGQRHDCTFAPTMDVALCRELFSNGLAAIDRLEIVSDLRQRLIDALDRLPDYQISPRDGRLLEWVEEYQETDPGHRHLSHLYGLYPGDSITARNPAVLQAARKSLD